MNLLLYTLYFNVNAFLNKYRIIKIFYYNITWFAKSQRLVEDAGEKLTEEKLTREKLTEEKLTREKLTREKLTREKLTRENDIEDTE